MIICFAEFPNCSLGILYNLVWALTNPVLNHTADAGALRYFFPGRIYQTDSLMIQLPRKIS